MPRTILLSSMLLATALALSACGENETAQVDRGGPIQTEEDGPTDLRNTADQLSKEAQEAAIRAQDRASEALHDAGEEADGIWRSIKDVASDAGDAISDAAINLVDAADDALGGGVLRDRSDGTLIGEDAPARPAGDLAGGQRSTPQQ